MKNKFSAFAPVTIALLMVGACADKNSHSQSANLGENNGSVETNKPNTDYMPAFAGQTRVKAVKTATAYEVVSLADGIGRPWAVVPLPDGRLC